MAKSQEVVRFVTDALAGFLAENSLMLYHAEYRRDGKEKNLNIFIDRIQDSPEGEELYVSTDDCEKVSRYLEELLDREDLIREQYNLMVSSPGLDRQLYEQRDFDRYVGRQVVVKLYQAIEGKKELTGDLVSRADGIITIREEDGTERRIPEKETVRTNLAVVF